MVRLLLVALLLFASGFASAADSYWDALYLDSTHHKFGSADAACRGVTSDYAAHNTANAITYLGAYLNAAGTSATCKATYNTSGNSLSTGSASLVTCPTSYPYFDGTSCVASLPPPPPPPSCPATDNVAPLDITTAWATGPDVGSAIAKKVVPDGGLLSGEWCAPDHCVQKVLPSAVGDAKAYIEQTATNGYFRVHVVAQMTQIGGDACDPDKNYGPPPPDGGVAGKPPTNVGTADGKCPAGSVPSGQDSSGMTICMGTATPPASTTGTTTQKPTTTTTDASGNTVSTDVQTKTNADGSTTTITTTTTTAPDGTKTVVVSSNTGNTSSGSQGRADSPSDPSDICKLHPELTVCRNSQVQGSCALITCDGDAIQCATLRAAAAMQCQQEKDLQDLAADPNSALGKAIGAGNDPKGPEIQAMLKGDTVDLSQTNLDQSGWLGGGACLAPITIQALGQSVTASFDSVCASIQPIRAAVLLMAFIIAYLLVARSILQS